MRTCVLDMFMGFQLRGALNGGELFKRMAPRRAKMFHPTQDDRKRVSKTRCCRFHFEKLFKICPEFKKHPILRLIFSNSNNTFTHPFSPLMPKPVTIKIKNGTIRVSNTR